MASNSCLFALFLLFIRNVLTLTNLDNEVVALGGSIGDWWYDDFEYNATGGYNNHNTNSWYNGYVAGSDLGGTVECSICTADPQQTPQKKIHGWYQGQTAGR